MIAGNKVENSDPNGRICGKIQYQRLLLRLRGGGRPVPLILGLLCGLLAGERQAQSAQPTQAPEALIQFNQSVEALVRKVSPSVVQVLVTGLKPLEEESHRAGSLVLGKQQGIGSGAIIDPDGYIVTNAHVVSGESRVQVVLSSLGDDGASAFSSSNSQGRTLEARVVGVSNELDLALLKVEAKGLPALPIGKYEGLRQGEIVFTFGSPSGLWNQLLSSQPRGERQNEGPARNGEVVLRRRGHRAP
jgi:serine protease Do